ncbi:hypothetical protein KR215_007945 [Drosophila sulfurigaster]|nr:hypothetical protein KR215_007945 [Drosophila sulfurigaster]
MGKFRGNIKDAMKESENRKFTTFDRDNDACYYYNCADIYYSGWWYNCCCHW